jgi:hypothetical protein
MRHQGTQQGSAVRDTPLSAHAGVAGTPARRVHGMCCSMLPDTWQQLTRNPGWRTAPTAAPQLQTGSRLHTPAERCPASLAALPGRRWCVPVLCLLLFAPAASVCACCCWPRPTCCHLALGARPLAHHRTPITAAHLLAHQRPQLVQVDDGAVVVVLLLVEVPHTNLQQRQQRARRTRQQCTRSHEEAVAPAPCCLPTALRVRRPRPDTLLPVLALLSRERAVEGPDLPAASSTCQPLPPATPHPPNPPPPLHPRRHAPCRRSQGGTCQTGCGGGAGHLRYRGRLGACGACQCVRGRH